jgi:hypothetical protein
MAGTFYSIQEVMEKLGKSEEQIKELVKGGKLREFRDGAKLLYKSIEVDSMVTDQEPVSQADSAVELPSDESGQVTLELDDTDTSDASLGLEDTAPKEETAPEETAPEETSAEDEGEKTAALTDIAALIDTGADADLGELTKADTSITSIGINVLTETDDGYALTDDTLGETNLAESTDELSTLGDDLNLDTAGSGSGLLDLSLQADDTSLGAVLDDILPAADQGPDEGQIGEGEGEGKGEGEGEVEKIFDQPEEAEVPPAFEPASAIQYVAPAPDAVDNACGIAMFLPLIALIYAAVVIVATFKGIVPAALTRIEGIVWYIASGMAVAAVAIIGIAALVGSKKAAARKKDVYQQTAEK